LLFIGDDWAEAHHDIEIEDAAGKVLARRRLPEGVAGVAALHALVGDHLQDADAPGEVVVGIETDRGPWVQALVAQSTRSRISGSTGSGRYLRMSLRAPTRS